MQGFENVSNNKAPFSSRNAHMKKTSKGSIFFHSFNLFWHVVAILTMAHVDMFLLVFLEINQHALYMVWGQRFHQP